MASETNADVVVVGTGIVGCLIAQQMLDAGMVAAGMPSDCIEVLDRFRDVGVDQVIMHMQMGGVPHADIAASIEALGKEVLPRYQ